jgi:hypothetical protein
MRNPLYTSASISLYLQCISLDKLMNTSRCQGRLTTPFTLALTVDFTDGNPAATGFLQVNGLVKPA